MCQLCTLGHKKQKQKQQQQQQQQQMMGFQVLAELNRSLSEKGLLLKEMKVYSKIYIHTESKVKLGVRGILS